MAMTSCSLINDDSDCVDSANVISFSYDKNLKFADAFDHEVKSVTLLAFDSNGTLAYAGRAKRDQLGDDGRSMTVRLAPGEYDMLVWAGDYDSDFNIPAPAVGTSRLTDFTCLLNMQPSHPDSPDAPATNGHSSAHLENLYHALVHLKLPYASPSNPARHNINLTKNTNNIRVMLQQQDAENDLSENDFIFEITDNNAHLCHDNSRHPESDKTNVTYHPWAVTSGITDYNKPEISSKADAEAKLNFLIAEFTTGRLFADSNPMLNVTRRSDGKTLFSFPLVDYALKIRGKDLEKMDNQEFLDRQDEYSMTFILDKNLRWISVEININGWTLKEIRQSLS